MRRQRRTRGPAPPGASSLLGRRDAAPDPGGVVRKGVLEVDVGHRGWSPEQAVLAARRALGRVASDPDLRVLKVIHGTGAGRGPGTVREAVRSWLAGEPRAREVVPGESFDIFDQATQRMRSACGHFEDPDLGRGNGGVTFVWVP